MSGALSTNGCSPTKFARRSRKEEKRPQWWGYNERSQRGWCSTTLPKTYERRNACHPQRLKTSRSAEGTAADYAHMHKLLVSLPPDPPPSFPAAILELKLAYFLSEQWGPPPHPGNYSELKSHPGRRSWGRSQLKKLGFKERIRGDHHIFTKDGVHEIVNIQPKGSQAKVYQV